MSAHAVAAIPTTRAPTTAAPSFSLGGAPPPQHSPRGAACLRTAIAMPCDACVQAHSGACLRVQCRVCSGNGTRAQSRDLHRANSGAVRSLLPDPRRRLVQRATRGARMGAISARQAITRSSTRRRARLRPRQPARTTIAAVRRVRPTQAAASSAIVMADSTSSSTPTLSAPASAARSCCAPVRPISLGRPRHLGVLFGTHAVLSGTHRGYSRRAAAVLPCGPSRTAGVGTIGYSWGTRGGTMGRSRGTVGSSRGTVGAHKYRAAARKEALDASHGLDARGLSGWARGAAATGARGTPLSGGVLMGVPTTCTTSCVHGRPHEAEGRPYLLTEVHTIGVCVTANAVAAIPTTRAPSFRPNGAPPMQAVVWRRMLCAQL